MRFNPEFSSNELTHIPEIPNGPPGPEQSFVAPVENESTEEFNWESYLDR